MLPSQHFDASDQTKAVLNLLLVPACSEGHLHPLRSHQRTIIRSEGVVCPRRFGTALHSGQQSNQQRFLRFGRSMLDAMRRLALFLIPLLVAAGVAQVSYAQVTYEGQAVQVSYEGQKVSAVDLIANPYMDVESLRPLVKQRPGEPYSGAKVQESIAALQQTGKFSKVELQVSPEAAGLRLAFVMEPAFYIGIIEFPGATKLFPYSRLLQVVNFPDESPFDKDALPKSEAALVQFLQQNGFFQAQVDTETQLDNTNLLANLIFHVTLGKRARIGRVEVSGPPPAEAARLLRAMRTIRAKATGAAIQPGKSYTPQRIKAGTTLLQKYLASRHFLANRVHQNPPQYHADTNRADVSFNVELGPTVLIQTTGAKLSVIPFVSGRRLKKLIPIYGEGAIDRELVTEGRQNLIEFFQKKGFFDVKVNTAFQRQPDKISVQYIVDKGKRHKVNRIIFRGNRHIDEDDLANVLAVKKHHLLSHGLFSDKLLKQSVQNLQTLYKDHGFEDVKVTPEVADHEPNIDITFQIAEGEQTLVDDFRIEGNQHVSADELQPPRDSGLRTGAPFSPRKLNDERNRILARYLDHGFLNADVKLQVNRLPEDSHKVEITYAVTENQQVRVSRIILLGQKRTRKTFLARTANIYPEAPLSQKDMLEGESKIYDLGIFDWASVGPRKPISTQTEEDALIKVHESKVNSITYGFGLEVQKRGGNLPTGTVAVPGLPALGLDITKFVTSEKRFVSPRGSFEYTRRNIRGLAETGAVAVLVSRLDQRILSTLTDPHFPGWSYQSLLSLSVERTSENPLFTARLGDASLQLEKVLDRKRTMRLQLRYDFRRTVLSQILIPNLVLPEDRSVRLSSPSATLIHDTRDKPLDPHNGFYQTLDLGITPKALGSSVNFGRLVGQFASYHPLGPIVWANSFRLGLAKPFAGSRVPTSERFFAGGGNTLRGFPLNGAGPQRTVPVCTDPNNPATCTNITVPVGGNQLFILNSEIRYPVPIISNLGGVVFYDGGNVYSNINLRQFIDSYTSTVGVGLRYATPVGPVRIDVGRNLNPIPGINPLQFFITLGHAF